MGWSSIVNILICSCYLIGFSLQRRSENSVITMINAKWDQAPLVLEISEFFAEENNNLFWTYVDDISNLTPPLSEIETEKGKYDICLEKAKNLLSPVHLNLLKLSLSLHVYSPRVEMYTQVALQRNLMCNPAVEVSGIIVCSVDELNRVLSNIPTNKRSEVFSLDHYYRKGSNHSAIAILYGEIGTPDFTVFHNILKQRAERDEIVYVFRHHVKNRINKRVRLSGYGVELQMKSTEYKAQDDSVVETKKMTPSFSDDEDDSVIEGFDFKVLKERFPEKHSELNKFRDHLLESSEDLIPLKVWQFQELGLQASQLIMNAPLDNVLNLFNSISQNFPMRSRSLVNVNVNPQLKDEIQNNQDQFVMSLNIQSAEAGLFINGMYFEVEHTDMITILEYVRRELRIMEGIFNLGLTDRTVIRSLLSLDLSDSSSQEFAVDIRDSAVIWINDLENDKKYRKWPTQLIELLKPTFPGMMRNIRRNLFNLVIICDPSNRKCWPLIKLAESFIVYSAAIRIGFVFSLAPSGVSGLENAGVALFNAFNYIAENYDRYQALSFITEVYASIKSNDRDVKVDDVKKRLKAKYYNIVLSDVLGSDSDYNTGRKLASDFLSRSGITSLPQVLVNGIPLAEKLLNKEDFEEAMLTEIMAQTPIYQKAVYKGELVDSDSVIDFMMNRPNVMPRLNNRVLNKENNKFLNLNAPIEASLLPEIRYVSKTKPGKVPLITYWIVGDFEMAPALKLLKNALDYSGIGEDHRFSVLINRKVDSNNSDKIINSILVAALLNDVNIEAVLKDEAKLRNGEKSFADYGLTNDALEKAADLIKKQETYVKQVLSFKAGDYGIVANGRVLGPFDTDEEFVVDDFSLLEKYIFTSYAEKVYKSIKSNLLEISHDKQGDVFMKISSLLNYQQQSKSRFQLPQLSEKHSVVKLPAKDFSVPIFDIWVVVDPISRSAQKIGPILSILYEILNAEIKIYLNPIDKISDMPLKSYYRFVLEPEIQFNEDGSLANGPIADFVGVSASSLLTQYMHVPENWLVESVVTPYDLDNIHLKDVGGTVYSQFELEYLLLEGHCYDMMYGNPPRGLQITLGTEETPVIMDTIVMANLGYFQLKANPGAWILRLREGRSADIYDIVSHEGADTTDAGSDIKVLISSFQSQILKLRVSKKPGKLHEQLLDDEPASSNSIWNSITSTFSGSGQESSDEETINIFSVASGHLYERFLRIMMLSVIKHTKSPVKFWFLKNYLSPSFKDFLPRMAEKYHFQYELVQYKWPRWLHQQTEKQRIIWGYKILFLDVLFPLDVKKIIFVDADQVVRADLKELVNLDLQGAPYGYTPFCSSRKEMDGFRFWRQGYWKTHLQGRSYHISALYVVDLKMFRKIAAGDRLRGQYQALSQDPNSLSNLDQDLPNNMIHQVAIKSLPQEWLWCETWCDNDSKSRAKTIDLCNNPLTKEAKLSAAMRIIEEWKDYDEEIKRLQFGLDETQHEEVLHDSATPPDDDAHSEL